MATTSVPSHFFSCHLLHHLNQNVIVHTIMHDEIGSALRNRLTTTAMKELASICGLLKGVMLTGVPDQRCMFGGEPFSTKVVYTPPCTKLLTTLLSLVWSSRVPNKIKVFGWLLHNDGLNTYRNLHWKANLPSDKYPMCLQDTETCTHTCFSYAPKQKLYGVPLASGQTAMTASSSRRSISHHNSYLTATFHDIADPLEDLGRQECSGFQAMPLSAG